MFASLLHMTQKRQARVLSVLEESAVEEEKKKWSNLMEKAHTEKVGIIRSHTARRHHLLLCPVFFHLIQRFCRKTQASTKLSSI